MELSGNLFPILIIFIFQFFACFADDGKFIFIFDQIEKCQSLEKERKEFEEMTKIQLHGWSQIEPKEELEKCKLKFDVKFYLGEIAVEYKYYLYKLENEYSMPIQDEFNILNLLSEDLKKLFLGKELLELLDAKVGVNKLDGEVWGNAGIERPLSSKGKMDEDSSSNGNPNHPFKMETNKFHLQMLEKLRNFRRKLNEEIKWLNLMIWLKIPKMMVERVENNLLAEKGEIQKFFENFYKKEAKQIGLYIKKGNVLASTNRDAKNQSLRELRRELEEIIKEWDLVRERERAKRKDEKNEEEFWGDYGKLVGRIKRGVLERKRVKKVNLDGIRAKMSNESKEAEAVKKLLAFMTEKWNQEIINIHYRIESFVDWGKMKEYEDIWHYVALNHVSSLMLKLMMEFFEWDDKKEKKMAALYNYTVEYILPYLNFITKDGHNSHLLAKLKRKFAKKAQSGSENMELDGDGFESEDDGDSNKWKSDNLLDLTDHPMLMEMNGDDGHSNDFVLKSEEDLRIQVALDALRVLTFFDGLNKLQQIGGTNKFLRARYRTKEAKEYEQIKSEMAKEIGQVLPSQKFLERFWDTFEDEK